MRFLMVLVIVGLVAFGQEQPCRTVPNGPVVVPLVLDRETALEADAFLRIEYRAAPNGRVLAIEDAEKVWWFEDKPVLILGATGAVFPARVSARSMAWVRLFDGDRLVGEYPIHPRRDRVRIQPNSQGMARALSGRLTDVNATYIAQVAHFLAGNSATLDVTGTTYSVDGVGTVIDENGQWVGTSFGYWNLADVAGNAWSPRDSDRDWVMVAMSFDGTVQTATAWDDYIYVSTDSGDTWIPRSAVRDWRGVAMSSDGMIQTAVVANGQIYVSTDSGSTWTPRESIRDWFKVAMSADGSVQSAVVLNGQIFVSTDSGQTWTARETARYWTGIALSDNGVIQTAVAGGGQIYVSTDTGVTWSARESARDWMDVDISGSGVIQVAIADSAQVYVSKDTGATWIPKDTARLWADVAISSHGNIQTATTYIGRIYVSTDTGTTWEARESAERWYGVAMSHDGTVQTAAVDGGRIYISRPGIGTENAVGVGTIDPRSNLDVMGNAIIDGDLTVTGSCTGCSSDLALKNDIRPLSAVLEKINCLDGVSFEWVPGTRDAQFDPGRHLGVIAQDVEQVFPEIVGIDSRGFKYVDYPRLVVPLIEAIKQLHSQSEERQTRIDHLEAKIEALESLIE